LRISIVLFPFRIDFFSPRTSIIHSPPDFLLLYGGALPERRARLQSLHPQNPPAYPNIQFFRSPKSRALLKML
jgi:hypothetical protein